MDDGNARNWNYGYLEPSMTNIRLYKMMMMVVVVVVVMMMMMMITCNIIVIPGEW